MFLICDYMSLAIFDALDKLGMKFRHQDTAGLSGSHALQSIFYLIHIVDHLELGISTVESVDC
jgi:hypothetical protein